MIFMAIFQQGIRCRLSDIDEYIIVQKTLNHD